jgi:DNA repair photolyase
MKVAEISCKSILNKSGILDYCINPYTGCQHACNYCYARFMKKYTKHKEEWGDFVDIKINAPEILKNELTTKQPKSIFISSVTDPYQPLEKKYKLTRRILEILSEHDIPVTIQTKSSLVLRDLDLIKKFSDIEIGFTITSLDDEVRKHFEPNSSSVGERLAALKILKENNIKTYVFFGPILPLLSDNIEEAIRKFSFTDCIYFDRLNIKSGNWALIKKTLERFYPGILKKYEDILFTKNDYYDQIKKRIEKECKASRVKCIICY